MKTAAGGMIALALSGIGIGLSPNALYGQPWIAGSGGISNSPITANVGIGTANPIGLFQVSGGYVVADKTRGVVNDGVVNSGRNRIWGVSTVYPDYGWSYYQVDGPHDYFGFHPNNDPAAPVMVIKGTGNVGIGNTNPQFPLSVWRSSVYQAQLGQAGSGSGAYTVLRMDNNDAPGAVAYVGLGGQTVGNWAMRNTAFFGTQSAHSASIFTSDYPRLTVNPAGNVGIGTTVPLYKLSVRGVIGAGEVIVTDTSGWPDYVFDAGYRLQPLGEVAEYIAQNHHLPEIPSAAEVAAKGVGFGEMQAKLLAKIEELTLHVIAGEKKNLELQERVLRVERENELLSGKVYGGQR